MDIDHLIREVTAEVLGQAPTKTAADASLSPRDVPAHLEHSMLNPDVSLQAVLDGCTKARRHNVAAVCVSPYYVIPVAEHLRGSSVKVGTAVGFPHGAMSQAAKVCDVATCVKYGAQEIDIAVNLLAVKSGNLEAAREDLISAADAARGKAVIKAVFEHSAYTEEETRTVLEMIASCGVQYVKIQNVLSGKPADVEQICKVRAHLPDRIKLKIDGGVKTLEQALQLLNAGADRIGLTATFAIAQKAKEA